MRLDRLTIGSAAPGPRHRFRNLKNVTIDFDQDDWVTVLIGWNGTGKSNILEALAIIFRDLIRGERVPAFAYQAGHRGQPERIGYSMSIQQQRLSRWPKNLERKIVECLRR
jgi:recombinational DNA repair ATPase RecF